MELLQLLLVDIKLLLQASGFQRGTVLPPVWEQGLLMVSGDFQLSPLRVLLASGRQRLLNKLNAQNSSYNSHPGPSVNGAEVKKPCCQQWSLSGGFQNERAYGKYYLSQGSLIAHNKTTFSKKVLLQRNVSWTSRAGIQTRRKRKLKPQKQKAMGEVFSSSLSVRQSSFLSLFVDCLL